MSAEATSMRLLNESLIRATEEALMDVMRLKAGFDPAQPRVPDGNSDGGQWTDEGGGSAASEGIREALRRPYHPLERVAVVASSNRDVPVPYQQTFKTGKAVESLYQNLSSKRWGDGKCAANVANAIRASGIPLGRPPVRENEDAQEPWARDYGETLGAVGFSPVAQNSSSGKYPPIGYKPQKGDVVVIQPILGQNPAGHMAMYDGRRWVSDFRQDRGIWSNRYYERQGADYKIYRHKDPR